MEKYTCYDCMKHYCHDCFEDEDGNEIYCMSDVCRTCNRRHCLNCSRERTCTSCNQWSCVDCMDTKRCVQCEESVCLSCVRECRSGCCEGKIWCDSCAENDPNGLRSCYNCLEEYCGDCCNNNPDEYLNYCNDCCQNLCRECQVIKSKEGTTNYCEGCHRFFLKATLEVKENQIQDNEKQLQEKERQIQEMQAEINKLKRKVKDMNGELEDNE